MKVLLLFIAVLYCSNTFACDCAVIGLIDRFESADFVATAEIKKVTPDTLDTDYHNIEIKINEIFKGSKVSKLKISSVLNSSCAFYTPENSKWLIFAYKDSDNDLLFGACSGAIQLDRKVDNKKYPGLTKKIELSNQRKLNVLKYLKDSELDIKNEFRLSYTFLNNCLENGKGFELKEGSFGLYEIKFNKKLRIRKITSIKKIPDQELNNIIVNCFRESFELYFNNKSKIIRSSSIIIGIYFYAAENEHPSFVSIFDL